MGQGNEKSEDEATLSGWVGVELVAVATESPKMEDMQVNKKTQKHKKKVLKDYKQDLLFIKIECPQMSNKGIQNTNLQKYALPS